MENVFHSRDGAQTTNRKTRKKERKKRTLQGLLHMLGSLQIPAAFFYDFSSLLGYRRGRVGSRDFPFPLWGYMWEKQIFILIDPRKRKKRRTSLNGYIPDGYQTGISFSSFFPWLRLAPAREGQRTFFSLFDGCVWRATMTAIFHWSDANLLLQLKKEENSFTKSNAFRHDGPAQCPAQSVRGGAKEKL